MSGPSPSFVEHPDPPAQEEWQRYLRSGMADLVRSYNFVHALFAFADSGLARRLEAGPASPAQLGAGLDPDLTRGLLRFLVIRGVLSATPGPEERYALTDRGRALVSDMAIAQMGFYREAYGPVLEHLSPLLRGAERYPGDVQRNGEALGRHCTTQFHYFGTSVLLEALGVLGARSFVDLGCGGGGFLIDACRLRPEMRAVGLDISEGAIDFARRSVQESGLGARIQLFVGDAFRPESWPAACREAEAITTVGTLHEQFRDGEDAVVALLDKYHQLMVEGPMKGVVVGEPELVGNEHDADFYLMHVFTRQGMPRPQSGWLPVFEKSRLRCESVLTAPGTGPRFAYYVLRPRA